MSNAFSYIGLYRAGMHTLSVIINGLAYTTHDIAHGIAEFGHVNAVYKGAWRPTVIGSAIKVPIIGIANDAAASGYDGATDIGLCSKIARVIGQVECGKLVGPMFDFELFHEVKTNIEGRKRIWQRPLECANAIIAEVKEDECDTSGQVGYISNSIAGYFDFFNGRRKAWKEAHIALGRDGEDAEVGGEVLKKRIGAGMGFIDKDRFNVIIIVNGLAGRRFI
jgi:hypothetical protein